MNIFTTGKLRELPSSSVDIFSFTFAQDSRYTLVYCPRPQLATGKPVLSMLFEIYELADR